MATTDTAQPAQIGPLHAFDVVVVPFPFTDHHATKRRPALVLTGEPFNTATSHSVLAMVTSASQSAWPVDVAITDLKSANLPQACVVRLKLFTLDHRLILRKAGQLSPVDVAAVQAAWAGQWLMADRSPGY